MGNSVYENLFANNVFPSLIIKRGSRVLCGYARGDAAAVTDAFKAFYSAMNATQSTAFAGGYGEMAYISETDEYVEIFNRIKGAYYTAMDRFDGPTGGVYTNGGAAITSKIIELNGGTNFNYTPAAFPTLDLPLIAAQGLGLSSETIAAGVRMTPGTAMYDAAIPGAFVVSVPQDTIHGDLIIPLATVIANQSIVDLRNTFIRVDGLGSRANSFSPVPWSNVNYQKLLGARNITFRFEPYLRGMTQHIYIDYSTNFTKAIALYDAFGMYGWDMNGAEYKKVCVGLPSGLAIQIAKNDDRIAVGFGGAMYSSLLNTTLTQNGRVATASDTQAVAALSDARWVSAKYLPGGAVGPDNVWTLHQLTKDFGNEDDFLKERVTEEDEVTYRMAKDRIKGYKAYVFGYTYSMPDQEKVKYSYSAVTHSITWTNTTTTTVIDAATAAGILAAGGAVDSTSSIAGLSTDTYWTVAQRDSIAEGVNRVVATEVTNAYYKSLADGLAGGIKTVGPELWAAAHMTEDTTGIGVSTLKCLDLLMVGMQAGGGLSGLAANRVNTFWTDLN